MTRTLVYLHGLFLCLLLASCATTRTQPIPLQQTQTAISWENRVQTLSSIQSWDLNALIAMRTKKDAMSASWKWQQTKNNYTMSLYGPLGAGAMKLSGSPGHVSLETSDGKHYTATSPESLLSQQLGWNIPVSNLYFWIRGLPAPNQAAHKELDNQNRLALLKQDGWTIQYLNYKKFGSLDLPAKLVLDNIDLNVKIIVRQWTTL